MQPIFYVPLHNLWVVKVGAASAAGSARRGTDRVQVDLPATVGVLRWEQHVRLAVIQGGGVAHCAGVVPGWIMAGVGGICLTDGSCDSDRQRRCCHCDGTQQTGRESN